MTGHDPYYVRRGWVDEDGHIRAIESSLKIMHSVDDVYGNDTTDDNDDAMTEVYTYPAPSEDGFDNPNTDGYFHLGEMVGLVDSTPPSPAEEMDYSPPTAGEDGELDLLATVTASKPNLHYQPLLLAAQSTYPVNQISSIYTQSVPYGNPQTIGQDAYAPPHSTIAPRSDMPMKHDRASMYGNFATSHHLASLPTATLHNTAPPVLPHPGLAPPAPSMTSVPAGTSHVTAALGMPPAGFVPPVPSMALYYHRNGASSAMPFTGFAPPGPTMASHPMTGLDNVAPPAPQHPTNYAPLLPNTTYPYRPVSGPLPSPDYFALSLPNGSRVGQPIPPDLHPIINAVRKLRIIGNTDHPERRVLKKPYEGTYENASRDGQIIRDHFAGGSGLLKVDSPLREWYGDLSVFSAKMWEFLMVQKARVNMNTKG